MRRAALGLPVLLLALGTATYGQGNADVTTLGGNMLQEVMRHQLVPFDQSKLKGFCPRTSIVAGAGEKIANLFWEENGNRLGFMLTESAQPSGVSDNPYVDATKGGASNSLEAQLAARIGASGGDLMPDQVLGLAIEVCGGDYWLATLTCHNLLKEVTYAERTGQRPLIGWDAAKPGDANSWVLLDPDKVTGKLRNLRPAGDAHAGDKMGPWYHMYGLFFIGGMTSAPEAEMLAWVENLTRKLGLGSKGDKFKEDMNTWAAGLCHSLNAMVEQGLYVPVDLSAMSKDELQATMDKLRAKHRALQGELEAWAGLVNHPDIGDAAVQQMDIIRTQQKAIYQEFQRVRAEQQKRPAG